MVDGIVRKREKRNRLFKTHVYILYIKISMIEVQELNTTVVELIKNIHKTRYELVSKF